MGIVIDELCLTWQRPTKMRPMAWKSNVSSQLNTSTNRPSWFPRALTDSVLPVPAGPKHSSMYLSTDVNLKDPTCK